MVEWIGTATDVEDARQTADEQRDLRARLLALTNGADALLAARTLDVTYAAAIDLARKVLSGDGYGHLDAGAGLARVADGLGLRRQRAVRGRARRRGPGHLCAADRCAGRE